MEHKIRYFAEFGNQIVSFFKKEDYFEECWYPNHFGPTDFHSINTNSHWDTLFGCQHSSKYLLQDVGMSLVASWVFAFLSLSIGPFNFHSMDKWVP